MRRYFLFLLCLMTFCTPTATFMRTGIEYVPKTKTPQEIAVYISPNMPEKNCEIVGTIIVSPNENVRNQEAYLNELRKKAAEAGVDGVLNVEIKELPKKQTQGGCISGVPYYYQENYNLYEIKGNAFVWK